MSIVSAVGTYLPAWEVGQGRTRGADEDAVTMAVAAGRALLDGLATEPDPAAAAGRVGLVVFVTRDLPLLEGGNSAALLAGLGLNDDVPVVEQVGGAPAVLDVAATAAEGTLVLAADLDPPGAGAVLIGPSGSAVEVVGRVTRSLPVTSRGRDGERWEYDDPRLVLERGTKAALARLQLGEPPTMIAGLAGKPTAQLSAGRSPSLPTTGASSAVFALAQAAAGDVLVGTEQASACAVSVTGTVRSFRDEAPPRAMPATRHTPGPDIGISLPAYERAFDAKLRWEAGSCDACGHLALPPRRRCTSCGSEDGWSLAPLPRVGEVYTKVDIHVPVPGRGTPYSLAIVQLPDTHVRALVTVTGAPAGTVEIGDPGRLVLRLVDTRAGVPDYGYAFLPDVPANTEGPDA